MDISAQWTPPNNGRKFSSQIQHERICHFHTATTSPQRTLALDKCLLYEGPTVASNYSENLRIRTYNSVIQPDD